MPQTALLTEVTRPSYRQIDEAGSPSGGVLTALGMSGMMELGVREKRLCHSTAHPELGTWFECKIGMGRATATLEVRYTHGDLFDVVIQQTRKRPGKLVWQRELLAQVVDIDIASIRRVIIATWCQVCSTKGW